MSINFNPEGKKTILSIDGGGMRGVIPVRMLAYLEDQTGKPAYELFDMVAGTSTGAIIAAGLGLGISAHDILELAYRTRLPKAFGATSGIRFWLRYIFRNQLRYQYSLDPFRESLSEFTNGKRVRDMAECIVLMTVKDLRTSNTYYVINRGPGAAAFGDWPVAGAVAASGAAPVFFPPVLGNLIDGGVGVHGNPSMAASVEAFEYLGFKPEETLHISLGTGYQLNVRGEGKGRRMNIFDWIPYIITESLDDALLQQALNTRAIYSDGKGLDFRRYNPDLALNNVTKVLNVDARGVNTDKLGLASTNPKEIAVMEDIGLAYAQAIDWSLPNQLPWDTVGGHPEPRIEPVQWRGSPYEVRSESG